MHALASIANNLQIFNTPNNILFKISALGLFLKFRKFHVRKNKEQLPLFALLKLFSLDLSTSALFTYPYLSYLIDFCQNSEKK